MSTSNHSISPPFHGNDILSKRENDSYQEDLRGRQLEILGFWSLFRLTIGLGGLQVVWSAIMSEGSPFLLSMGLHPSIVSLVWLAGPICGTVLQPYIGYKSDNCTHKWGRRKPFIVYGTLATMIFLNLLPWTSEIINLICHLLELNPHHAPVMVLKMILVVIWIWALNVAIQPVQAGIRALIVDSCSAEQQVQASSFTSCVVIVGSAVGYGCGFLKMPKGPEVIENTQFKGLCFIASFSLGICVAITSMTVRESSINHAAKNSGYGHIYREISRSISILPPKIRRVCAVQFFSWLTWFPFLFSISTYLSKLYEYQVLSEKMGRPSFRYYTALQDQSIRHATLAMLLFSVIALLTSLALPTVLTKGTSVTRQNKTAQQASRCLTRNELDEKPNILTKEDTKINWISLPRAWMYSHVLVSFCMLGVTLTDNFICVVSFTAILGISWALTQWVPFAIIGSEIAKEYKVEIEESSAMSPTKSSSSSMASSSTLTLANQEVDIDQLESQKLSSSQIGVDISSRAATIMGVHNIAIAMPQILSAILGSIIYGGFDFFKLGEANATAWVLRVGYFSGLAAAYFSRGLN